MNCQMLAAMDSGSSEAAAALAQVPHWFEAWEQCLSRFRADSELSVLNRNTGQWMSVSADLLSVIEAALWAAKFSDGLVSPTLLGAMERAGYDRSFESIASAPLIHQVTPSLNTQGWQAIQTDSAAGRVFVPAARRIYLKGIA